MCHNEPLTKECLRELSPKSISLGGECVCACVCEILIGCITHGQLEGLINESAAAALNKAHNSA